MQAEGNSSPDYGYDDNYDDEIRDMMFHSSPDLPMLDEREDYYGLSLSPDDDPDDEDFDDEDEDFEEDEDDDEDIVDDEF